MIGTFLDRLRACRTDREFFKVHTEAERVFTPLEIHQLLDQASALPQPTQDWLDRITRFTRFCEKPPMRYRRREIAANIDLYDDADIARSAKRLIIGFCGTAQRLLMPVASVLQLLPSQECDLLVLRDSVVRDGIEERGEIFPTLLTLKDALEEDRKALAIYNAWLAATPGDAAARGDAPPASVPDRFPKEALSVWHHARNQI